MKIRQYLSIALFVAVAWLLLPIVAFAQDVGDGSTTPLDSLSDFALFSIVSGAATSLVTAMINRRRWASDTKLAMFFALCCVTAAGNAYFLRQLDFENWVRSLLLVVASGFLTYQAAKPAIKTVEMRTG